MPAIGYTHADQSHFTSRHYWEVGATSTQLRTGWLGRYLDRVGTMDNPLQGLSLDDALAPALATAKVPVASIDGPDQYDFWATGVWGEVEQRDARGDRRARRRAAADPALQAAGASRRRSTASAAAAAVPATTASRLTSPVAVPEGDDAFPKRLAGLAAMLAAGPAAARRRADGARRVRHARRTRRRRSRRA